MYVFTTSIFCVPSNIWTLVILDNIKFPKYSEIVNVCFGDGTVHRGQVLEINGNRAVDLLHS